VASVIEYVLEDVFALLTDVPDSQKLIGERHVGEHLAPGTVIAVPLGAQTIDTTNQPGYEQNTDDVGEYRARRLYTRWFSVRFVVCARGFEDCESLYLDTLRAVRKAFHNGIRPSGETWIDQQADGDGAYNDVNVIEFMITFEIPVWGPKKYLTTVTGISTNCDPEPDPP
jgi:hypothetical protein